MVISSVVYEETKNETRVRVGIDALEERRKKEDLETSGFSLTRLAFSPLDQTH